MMDQFWEMYEAYCNKKRTERIQDTDWGKSGPGRKAGTKGEKWNGRLWLEKCYKNIVIKVIGKWFFEAIS